jgi:hypothetical protein
MVVRAPGPPGRRIILYNYEPARTTEALKQLLIGVDGPYRGKLLTDGPERYDEICQAFGGRSLARVAIEKYIRQVYRIEGQIKELREECEKRGEHLSLEAQASSGDLSDASENELGGKRK